MVQRIKKKKRGRKSLEEGKKSVVLNLTVTRTMRDILLESARRETMGNMSALIRMVFDEVLMPVRAHTKNRKISPVRTRY